MSRAHFAVLRGLPALGCALCLSVLTGCGDSEPLRAEPNPNPGGMLIPAVEMPAATPVELPAATFGGKLTQAEEQYTFIPAMQWTGEAT